MLKIGVFGAGHLGRIHIQQWQEIPGSELVGFYDPNDENAAKAEAAFQIKRFSNAQDLIEAVDAVDIVTTTTAHFAVAKDALRKSRHLFIEKPLTHSLKGGEALVKLINEANVKCQVGHVERYNPAILAVKGHDIKPMFVETHRLAQFNPRGTDVAVVLDLMIHDIDVLLHFVNSPMKKVSANGVAVLSDTPDIANAHLEFENGCVANLTASRISLKNMRKMRLFQRDAYIGIDFLKKKTEFIRLKEDGEKKGPLDFSIQVGKTEKKIISVETPEVKPVNAIREELASFTLSILKNQPVQVSAMDGLKAMELAHQIMDKINRQMIPNKIN